MEQKVGILSDADLLLLGESIISPFNSERVQPASYDLLLGGVGLLATPPLVPVRLDPRDPSTTSSKKLLEEVSLKGGYALRPGRCLLASTEEVIHCPSFLAARVEGKSSLGRLFLSVHVTAGFVDPGFKGQITLEIVNHSPWEILLTAGMKIAQINFIRLATPCLRPYGSKELGSHYQGQMGPTQTALVPMVVKREIKEGDD